MRCAPALLSGLCALPSGCLLDDAPPPRALQGRTLLAIVAEPAEALPGEHVTYRAVVASPDGPEIELDVSWSFCSTPRPLSENAAASAACATGAEQPIAARGLTIAAPIPEDACARFGPETTAGVRPTDPDQSGGYYQPVRAQLAGLVAVHRQRVRCALANAPFEVVRRFQREYRPNRAPGIQALRAHDKDLVAGDSTELVLELAPDTRETYLTYDSATASLRERTESLDARWFVSAGGLVDEHATAAQGTLATRWIVPAQVGRAWVWAVVRDDRGGVSVAAQRLDFEVRPPPVK